MSVNHDDFTAEIASARLRVPRRERLRAGWGPLEYALLGAAAFFAVLGALR